MAETKTIIDYRGKSILAPMVRIGTLPSRLLALQYGADIVYTEEIIDFKMLRASRVENEMLDTVDFVMDDGTVVFRTCAAEKDSLVFQIGTSDPNRALKVAKMVEKDISAFDVNMGCPKTFSISGGMGAALLRQPDRIKQILTTLVDNLSIPVTCKIRCLNTTQETVELAKLIQSTGVAALAIHGRTRDERPRHQCRYSYIKEVADTLSIPVIANGGSGDIKSYSDIEKFRLACGASSVMIARAAESNISIFKEDGILSKEELIREYLKIAIDTDNHWTNTKYCLQQILGSDVQSGKGERLLASKCPEDIYSIYDMMDIYKSVSSKHKEYLAKKQAELERDLDTVNGLKVKIHKDNSGVVVGYESHHQFDRKFTQGNATPKMFLIQHMRKLGQGQPDFVFEQRPVYKHFRCTLIYDNVKYISTQWHKRKVWAEHAACEIYMQINGIINTDAVVRDGRLSSSQVQDTSEPDSMKVTVCGVDVTVSVCRDDTGEVTSYSSLTKLSSPEQSVNTAMDVLYKHLLKRNEPEPEYDLVSNNDDEMKCTLRHQNVEYTSDQWFSNKREAVNALCALYMSVNKIPYQSNSSQKSNKSSKRLMDEDANGHEKHMKMS